MIIPLTTELPLTCQTDDLLRAEIQSLVSKSERQLATLKAFSVEVMVVLMGPIYTPKGCMSVVISTSKLAAQHVYQQQAHATNHIINRNY